MIRRSYRPSSPVSVEALEQRQLLSAAATSVTSLKASTRAAKLGQDVTLQVTVRDTGSKTRPTGSVEFLDNGTVINGLSGALTVPLDKSGRASYVLGAGDVALFTGSHSLTAKYLGDTASAASTSKAVAVTISAPSYSTTSDGLKQATLKKGHGRKAAAGNTVLVSYTGFLASNGTIFDFATGHGTGTSSTLNFVLDSNPEAVIKGFDEGVSGMKAGQIKTLDIPATLGYGSTANGSIPANSELIFVVKLQSIA